jgi:dTDP-4-dehydrorhamnose reductase
MRVVVTGAAGQLGTAVAERFRRCADVLALPRQALDITDDRAVSRVLEAERPDVLINCASFNDVDGAEARAFEALTQNAFGVLTLARAAAASRATLVHYSTDFVFDGAQSNHPYTEADAPGPQSNYARSKLLGEWFAADVSAHYVLRVESLFGGARAKSSVDKILDGIRRGEAVRVFSDRIVTPSYVVDVAEATACIVERHVPYGLYHCVNSGESSWLGIARELERLLGREADLLPVSVDEVKLRASRPRYCSLSNQKLREAGIDMPTWQDALRRYVEDLQS